MTIKTDNQGAIDTTYPPLPATRRTSQMAHDVLTAMNTSICDTITAIQDSVSSLGSSKADVTAVNSALSSLTGTVTTLQASLATVATSGSYNDLSSKPTIPSAVIAWVPVAVTRSIVTTTGANGFKPSATNNILANYNINVSTTANISGAADGYAVLKVCATNSATESDWIIVAKTRNAQALSLAVALQSVQQNTTPLIGTIPKNWYGKILAVTTSGTASITYDSGAETPMS